MLDETNTNIKLVVAGFICDSWDSVRVDSQIDVPADSFNLSLFNPPSAILQPEIRGGAPAQLYYGDELLMIGIVDQFNHSVSRGQVTINLYGRDLAGQMIDCSVPIKTTQQVTLEQLIMQHVLATPLGTVIHNFIVQNDAWLKNKVSIEPSESIYDAIAKAAQVTGQWVWMREDGVLMVGDPFANTVKIATPLQLMYGSSANNVLSLEYSEDVSGLFSDIKLLSQDNKASAISAESQATTPYAYARLKLITLGDIDTQAEAQAAINKIQHDNDLEAYTLTAVVAGWTIDGRVWRTGFEVNVKSDVVPRANAKWVVLGRTLELSRTNAKTTTLKLKRAGDWVQPLIYKEAKAS